MASPETKKAIELFKEEVFDQIKKGHAYKCFNKLLNEKEIDSRVKNKTCIECICGDLEPQCGGNYYPLIKIAGEFWNIRDIYNTPDYLVN